MKASQRIHIKGQVSSGFEAVREAFAENFSRRNELGGAPSPAYPSGWCSIEDFAMKYVLPLALVFSLAFSMGSGQARAGSVELGLGLGFASSTGNGGFEGGWDLMGGYEWREIQDWHVGGQLHLIRGWTSRSKFNNYPSNSTMTFDSAALLAAIRPRHEWFDWLQLKAGLVNANFKTLAVEGGGTGLALGAGIVMGSNTFRLHLLDIEEYWVDGREFTTVSISIGLFR